MYLTFVTIVMVMKLFSWRKPMIDIATLTALLSPFLPYLVKAGEKAAEEAGASLGGESWNWVKQIWGKLSPKVEKKPALKEIVGDVAANLQDEDYKAALRGQLKKLLEQDPTLEAEIAQLLKEKPQGAGSGIGDIIAGGDVQVSTGDQTVSQSGGGINIGQARDVSLGQPSSSQEKTS